MSWTVWAITFDMVKVIGKKNLKNIDSIKVVHKPMR